MTVRASRRMPPDRAGHEPLAIVLVSELIALSILPLLSMMLPAEVDVTVQVDEVQSVPDGFGFHLKASEYTWITLVFDNKAEAEAAHSHAEKAVAKAKALKVVNR